ncbi:MAG TPA: ATP-binding protein [Candidatus Eisenbacteria bacterium]|nr:ATP-binding protein [Candidatus Eisenbacteria bacterium]
MAASLRLRLLWTYALVVVGALLAATLIEARVQRGWILRDNARVLERAARQMAADLPDDPAGARGDWDRAVAARDALTGLRVTLIARDGRVLADSRARAAALENHAGRPEVRAALAGRAGEAERRSRSIGVELQYVAVPAIGRVPYAVVRVAEPLRFVHALGASLLRLSAGAAALTLAGGLLLVLWATGRHAGRIRALAEVAGRIGAGEAGARAPERPADELGRLGAALNRMAAELHARLLALERERDEREHILAHMTDGVALVDPAGRIARCNHSLATILGAPRPAAPGTPLAEYVRSPELDALVRRARAEGGVAEADLRLWAPEPRVVRAGATALGEAGVLIVLHDLTQAEALNRVRQDFVANVSHELRTPLTSLRGYAETLLDGALEDADRRGQFVTVIRDQAVRLQALVDDLLALSELEREGTPLRRTRFDLREALAQQLGAFRAAAARANLALALEPGPAVEVEADRTRLEQVIANLLDNALKYTERGGVSVRAGGDAALAWFEVADTGPGIPAAERARIFERFYRLDKARSRDQGGTGLGLSIVKHIVALHGGEVAVTGAGPGATFRVELPRVPPAAPRR